MPHTSFSLTIRNHGTDTFSSLQSYKRRSQEESAKNEREYQSWVTSHTPEQIRQANLARAELKRLKVPGFTLYKEIKDNRQLTRPGNAFSIFVRDVKEDVGLTSVGELGREAARRWRSLEPSEKQVRFFSPCVRT